MLHSYTIHSNLQITCHHQLLHLMCPHVECNLHALDLLSLLFRDKTDQAHTHIFSHSWYLLPPTHSLHVLEYKVHSMKIYVLLLPWQTVMSKSPFTRLSHSLELSSHYHLNNWLHRLFCFFLSPSVHSSYCVCVWKKEQKDKEYDESGTSVSVARLSAHFIIN